MFARRIAFPILFLAIWSGDILSASAQSEPTSNVVSNSASEAATQNTKIRFSLDSQSKLGAYPIVPEHWSDLHLRLENSGDSSHDLLCTSYFEANPSLQYGRQVWLPPHSRLTLPHPALIPHLARDKATSINVSSLVMERTSGAEVLLKTDSEQLRHDRTLMLTQPSRITGIVFGGSGKTEVPQDVIDIVIACRVTQRLNNKVTILADDFLPTDENSLRYLDHLVVADNRLIDDYAALAAVRRWMNGGGRLWVMLDRVKPEFLERLLGDDFHGHVADHVSLTSVRIDSGPTLKNPNGEAGETLTFDEPVDISRLVVTGMKVLNTVDGWPAALSMPCGEGSLFVTTVGPRAWIKPTPPNSSEETDPPLKSAYTPHTPMKDLSTQLLGKREPPLLINAEIESLAREYISYKIPNRTLITGAMGGFLAILLLLGTLLWWQQRLEHFGWSGSLVATLAALVFLGIGQSSRQGIPPTQASFQLTQAISGTDDIRSQGAVAVYRSEPTQTAIQTRQGGVLETDLKGMEGVTLRMITTDLLTFQVEGLPQRSGLQLFSESTSRSNFQRYEARASLNANGLSGQFIGDSSAGADAMIATRFGRIGVEMQTDGSWSGGVEDIFAADQYLAANFLGTEQERRRHILEMLFGRKNWKNLLQRPQLLVWLKEWPEGFTFGDGLTRQGQSLLILPVEITRPPAGTQMQIPAPLITFGTRMPPDGSVPSGCWDDNLGRWQERTGPCTTWLNFQIPHALLPAKAMKANLTIKVSGAIDRIEVLSVKNNAVVSLQKTMNPVGTIQIEIADASVLELNEEGELALGISVGDPERAATNSDIVKTKIGTTSDYWKIESLGLNVWANTTEPLEKE